MSSKDKILEYLELNKGTFISGESMATDLALSRTGRQSMSLEKADIKLMLSATRATCLRMVTTLFLLLALSPI